MLVKCITILSTGVSSAVYHKLLWKLYYCFDLQTSNSGRQPQQQKCEHHEFTCELSELLPLFPVFILQFLQPLLVYPLTQGGEF